MTTQDSITKLSPKKGEILVVRTDWLRDPASLAEEIAEMVTGLQVEIGGIVTLGLDESLELLSEKDLDALGLQRKV